MNLVTAEMCADRVYRAEAENDRSIDADVQRLRFSKGAIRSPPQRMEQAIGRISCAWPWKLPSA